MVRTSAGRSFPIGARYSRRGVNFSVFSRYAMGMELLLFHHADDERPAAVIPFDRHKNRTGPYWHIFVPGLKPGQLYGFRAIGTNEPARGRRFNPEKLLIDPYGLGVVFPKNFSRAAAIGPGDNAAQAMKSMIVDVDEYDWQGDLPLHRPFSKTVIYEMHLAGFTRHPNSGVPEEERGTYRGLIHKIPYLKGLGVTAVELLPIYAFDPTDAPTGVNYWGYSPVSFFAPHPFYSADYRAGNPLGPVDEFRDLVKALHRAGIEVILDVVYNHTAEGDAQGPMYSFKGLDNDAYYILEPNRRYYSDYSGTGNTFDGNHPVGRRMILDSLRYWVSEMHVDGFRFDLASILARDEEGVPLVNPPVLWDIELDPVLAGTKLIAEAWDAAGLYQVGWFIGERWKEWNGKFRDDVRRFVRGDPGAVRHMPNRLLGSPDVYEHEDREPEQSVNFITCHDGFTLYDLVSYDVKHNEANGENNRDGADENVSWNHGVEGPTTDPQIQALRERQMKNFFTYTLLSLGTPMLLMGDEVARTQGGNNNAYCQDNEISWFDWDLVGKNANLHRFVKELILFRLRHASDPDDEGKTLAEELREAGIAWHGLRLHRPDWSDESRSLALTASAEGRPPIHMMMNAYWETLAFELPPGSGWRRLIDTSLDSPEDICRYAQAPAVPGSHYPVGPRSVVVLVEEPTNRL